MGAADRLGGMRELVRDVIHDIASRRSSSDRQMAICVILEKH